MKLFVAFFINSSAFLCWDHVSGDVFCFVPLGWALIQNFYLRKGGHDRLFVYVHFVADSIILVKLAFNALLSIYLGN